MTHQELKIKLLETNYFEDNKYLDKYCELIINNLEIKKEKFKTQGHHIIPQCYYNLINKPINNPDENMVNLSYINHVMAHYYLCLCTKEELVQNLRYPFICMTALGRLDGQGITPEEFNPERDLNEYQAIYENYCKKLSSDRLGKKASEETKKKMSYPRSEEMKKHLSKARKGMPNPKSGEARRGTKRPGTSEKLKGKSNLANCKYFNIYCLELDEMFSTTFEAEQKYPEYHANKISTILKGSATTYKNTHWCCGFATKEESKQYLLNKIEKDNQHSRNEKNVQNLNTGKVYNSARKAEIEICGERTSSVGMSAYNYSKGKYKKAYGFYWIYLDNHNNIPYTKQERQEILQNIENSLTPRNAIPVQNLETGEVFKSSAIASNYYSKSSKKSDCVGIACSNYNKDKNVTSCGYHWIRLYNNREPYTPEERQELLAKILQNS